MVHEPYLEFRRGPLRHLAMACVHRLMTMVLLRAARKVWMSIPAWEPLLRPYALGRKISDAVAAGSRLRRRCERRSRCGDPAEVRCRRRSRSLGTFRIVRSGGDVAADERLPQLMEGTLTPSLLLLGSGGERYRDTLLDRHPSWSTRVHAAGYLSADDLSAHIAACDLFVQPYPDGISSRRTSAMACLSQARPLVTTKGHLTEAAVAASTRPWSGGRRRCQSAFARVAVSCSTTAVRGQRVGARGQQLYQSAFAVDA